MKLIPCGLIFFATLLAPSAPAGTITGTVRAEPASPPSENSGDGAYGSRRYKFVERVDYERLQDFVVSIDQPVPAAGPATAKPQTVVQRDANFEPHVLPIEVGTAVRWPNEDDIYHNVFSMSELKPFDLNLYKKGEHVPEVVFDKVGRVDVFCGIHTQMHCIILVLPNPFFALADGRGRYKIEHVPAGTYHLKAWHERVPGQVKEVVVPAEGEVKVDFVLGVGQLPKY
jgi:plastocyanin